MRFRRTKIRYRRRYLLMPILFVVIVPIVVAWANTLSRSNSINTVSPQCKKGNPWGSTYNPQRFRVLSNCETGIGTVTSITHQRDGDIWIKVAVDHEYSKLLGLGNVGNQNGLLVLEGGSEDQNTIPSVGERISFVGPLVYDIYGEFNAITPVWSITPS